MGIIEFNHSAPGTGKTFSVKAQISRDYKRGIKYKTLFLVPLKSLRQRERYDLIRTFGVKPQDVHILKGKNEAGCSLLRNSYNILASLVLCSKCPSKNCLYRQLIKHYLDASDGIWIGDHRFLPFSVFGHAKRVIVDEYDALLPNYFFQPISQGEFEALLRAGVITKRDIEKLYKKGMILQRNGTLYVASSFFIVNVAIYASQVKMLSATPFPDPYLIIKVFIYDPEEQPISDKLVIAFENEEVKIRIPNPYVPSNVKIRGYYIPRKVFMRSPDRMKLIREFIPEIVSKLNGKITIIAGSKAEMHRVRYILEKKLPHIKIASEDVPEYSLLDQANVRIITVAGRLSRGWDLDSYAVIALWQYDRPDEAIQKIQLYDEIFPQVGGLQLYKYMQYRRHIQTLFRTIRRYDRQHLLILLDRSWYNALSYFPTTRFLVEKGYLQPSVGFKPFSYS